MLPFQNFPYKLVLGSASPRRKDLLSALGFEFETISKDVDESYPLSMPRESVPEYLSHIKSVAFSDDELPQNYLLITADTMVLLDNKPFGKPADRDQAVRFLYALSGQTHKVRPSALLLGRVESNVPRAFVGGNRVLCRQIQALRQSRFLRYPGMDRLCGNRGNRGFVLQCDGAAHSASLS